MIALHAAVVAPEAIRSLTLYEPVAFGVLDAPNDADARATLSKVTMHWGSSADEHEGWLEQFVDYWGEAGAWRALREARAEFRRVGWVVREGVRSLVEDPTRGPTFAAIAVPTHLLSGTRSPIAGRVVRRLGEAIRGARVTSVAGVQHMAPVANADLDQPTPSGRPRRGLGARVSRAAAERSSRVASAPAIAYSSNDRRTL